MTEKRFEVNNNKLIDNSYNTFYFINDTEANLKLFCARLNNLHEENEQLKKERNYWEKSSKFWKRYESENNQLKEENEQLKQQIDNCKNDEKQLSIDFMGFKMNLIEVLRNHYLECQKWGDSHTQLIIKQIANDLRVDLE